MTSTNPAIYGRDNLQNPRISFVIQLCLADRAAAPALVAWGGLAIYKRRRGLSNRAEDEESKRTYSEAVLHVSSAVRAMSERLANVQAALSESSINAASLLAVCSVSGHFYKQPGLSNGVRLPQADLDTLGVDS
jgi:hypothetical protein